MVARYTSFLVKVASRCNLDCDYCYVYHHADQSWRSLPPLLLAGDRAAFAQRLASYVASEQITRCAVIFHGGEPLLAGAESLVTFARTIRAAVSTGIAVDIGLQTNGLLLTDAALVQFAEADITVSLSLDGPKEANDLHRNSRRGRSSFDRAFSAMERLKRFPSVFAGVIAVIDPRVAPETLFAFFDEHSPPKLDFLLPDAHHLRPPPDRADCPSLYRDWLIRAFDTWFDRYPHLHVRTFEALLDALAGLPSGTDSFGFGDVSLLSVETDGSYHDLDVFKVTVHGATKLAGSVRDTEIAIVAKSPAVASHRNLLRKDGLCETCQACPEVSICGGGSVPHRYGMGGFNHPTVYCEELLSLIRHVRERLRHTLGQQPSVPSAVPDFTLSEFERAEDATSAINELWDGVCAQEEHELHEALDALIASGCLKPEEGEVFERLSDSERRAVSSYPGVVAWQRTVRRSSRGGAVHAVDGTPIVADASYFPAALQRWSDANAASLVALAGVDDPWLRIPFGSAIIFESDRRAAAARPVLAQALAIIDEWRPAIGTEIRRICSAVQFVRDPAAHPEKIVSFSDNAVPGALYVSAIQGERLIDPYDLADSVIHEYRHQKLYLLERTTPLMAPTSRKVVSPWRDELRPPSGLLHAVFVFVELRHFWQHVLGHGPERLALRARNQLLDTDRNLSEAFKTLADCPLTPAGAELVAILRDLPHSQSTAA